MNKNSETIGRINLSRRSFVVGGAACAIGAGAAVTGMTGCKKADTSKTSNLTKSGLDPKKFESEGIATFNTGFTAENLPTSTRPTKLYTITNSNGAELCITNLGARIVSLMVPDKNGNLKNMVLGFNTIQDYANFNKMPNNFYGAVVGRFANRIGKGQFVIDGKQYQVDVNETPNMLHGGKFGWHFQTFEVESFDENKSIKLKLVSPDGDMGFPGEVTLYVTYTLNDNNTLGIYYEATTTAATVLNVSNHAYWDVSGDPNSRIVDDYLFLPSTHTTPIDEHVLTTGEIVDITKGGAFDFFCDGKANNNVYGKKIGRDLKFDDLQTVFGSNVDQSKKDALVAKATTSEEKQMAYGKGYDHNFCVLDRETAKALGVDYDGKFEITDDGSSVLSGTARLGAKMHSDVSGITMTIVSTEPGMQFYDGFDLDGTLDGLDNKKITQYAGVALEPQHYPDWPNNANFASNYLRPGETFRSKSEYRFTV